MNRVKGKVCIVTGAALGVSRACALRLAEEGARVALFDVLDAEGRPSPLALPPPDTTPRTGMSTMPAKPPSPPPSATWPRASAPCTH
jgi:hypothetical protein